MSVMNGTSRQRGFTLLELLIVIAIIGILSAVTLVALTTARGKGTDAAIKKVLSASRRQAELFVDANGRTYANVCTNTTVNGTKSIYENLNGIAGKYGYTYSANNDTGGGAGIVKCIDTSNTNGVEGWAAQAPLKSGTNQYFCVDYLGQAVTRTGSGLAANDVDCR